MDALNVAVVGGGPAGLRAAEVAAMGGARVCVYDAKPSVGRKFLVAGKGGMNITHDEAPAAFVQRYRQTGDPIAVPSAETLLRWTSLLKDFDPAALRAWAAGLGVETFTATTGRVYPREMKSAPLLRRWVARLRSLGVVFHMRHQWTGLNGTAPLQLAFRTERGTQIATVDAAVLALGGASWPKTGSTGEWAEIVANLGIKVNRLQPANCGWECGWPESILSAWEGKPLKNLRASVGSASVRGELLVTRYGLEGGVVYALSNALRAEASPVLWVDFKPDSNEESLVRRLGSARKNLLAEACARWRLGVEMEILLSHLRGALPFSSSSEVAGFVKRCPIPLSGPRCISEAISSAGGVCTDDLDENLMVRGLPGLFVAGEMLDWEAPTGGYLMQGCFATGTRAGEGLLQWKR